MNPRAKDTELRWETIALIKQIDSLIADPDLVTHDDRTLLRGLGARFESLVDRSRWDNRWDHPTQVEYRDLFNQCQEKLDELVLIQLNKHRLWCTEQATTHWSDEARVSLKQHASFLLSLITQISSGDSATAFAAMQGRSTILD